MIKHFNDSYNVSNTILEFSTNVSNKIDAININENLKKSIAFINTLFKYHQIENNYHRIKFNLYNSGLIYSLTFIYHSPNNQTISKEHTIFIIYKSIIQPNIIKNIDNEILELKNNINILNIFKTIKTFYKINLLKKDKHILINYCRLLGA